MPRKARIDAPGALHHIICRGIERRKIFDDDADRDNFLERLGNILKETLNALLRLGADTESFSFVIANRQSTDFHSHAPAINRLCRQLQSSPSPHTGICFKIVSNPYYVRKTSI